jgi:hypothetical protein
MPPENPERKGINMSGKPRLLGWVAGVALAFAFVFGATQSLKAQSHLPVTTAVFHPTADGKVHAEPVHWHGYYGHGYGYGYGYHYPYHHWYGGGYYSYYRPYYWPYAYRPYYYSRVYAYYPYVYPYTAYNPGYFTYYPRVAVSLGYSYPAYGYYYW